MYVTSKYLTKKPEVKPKKMNKSSQNAFLEAEKAYNSSNHTIHHSKRNSIQSIASIAETSIKCKDHSLHSLKYFCYDCQVNGNVPVLLCAECVKDHGLNSKHKIVSLKQAH